ncbi:hypothetical protein D9756_004999 [Leucocoprinus leucothites]|uniref:Gelsolin-like domain-containing protein n=1 Tax=Leucocoprinus leucothites TaxID=201217 RepID=A0A8H5G9Q3_9AGAR|nr:hypothetical protein D9756_004999 [Leucoagaricus leucothites]
MAHLTKLTQYNIEDSNIALLGSDLEKNVREHGGDKEAAWEHAGTSLGLQIWRIEQFHVVEWPADRYGCFYDGDSYIVLHTYKRTPDATSYSYNLHFWLGQQTTQDEAGTAAYKTVELDDRKSGINTAFKGSSHQVKADDAKYRSSWDACSIPRSPGLRVFPIPLLFPQFYCLRGGIATGFHHVTEPPPLDMRKLYRVNLSRHSAGRLNLVVREVPAEASSLIEGDVYVLDLGTKILQFNTKQSAGQERFKSAEFVRSLANERKGESEVVVYDEGGPGASLFLTELGAEVLVPASVEEATESGQAALYRLSDATGSISFTSVAVSKDLLSTNDAFLLDNSQDPVRPAVYVWLGRYASLNERRLSLQYAQNYLYSKKRETSKVRVTIPIIKQEEGFEVADFFDKLSGEA